MNVISRKWYLLLGNIIIGIVTVFLTFIVVEKVSMNAIGVNSSKKGDKNENKKINIPAHRICSLRGHSAGYNGGES